MDSSRGDFTLNLASKHPSRGVYNLKFRYGKNILNPGLSSDIETVHMDLSLLCAIWPSFYDLYLICTPKLFESAHEKWDLMLSEISLKNFADPVLTLYRPAYNESIIYDQLGAVLFK